MGFNMLRNLLYVLLWVAIAYADIQQMVESSPAPSPAPFSTPVSADAAPHVANTVVLSWANESMVTTFSYDFANYNTSFQIASNYYTPAGWVELTNRHKELKDLEQVLEKKMTMSAVASGPAKLISQGPVNGVYSWLVEAPYLLVASDTSHDIKRNILVRSLIVRADPDVHYRGLAIDKIAIKYIVAAPNNNQVSGDSA